MNCQQQTMLTTDCSLPLDTKVSQSLQLYDLVFFFSTYYTQYQDNNSCNIKTLLNIGIWFCFCNWIVAFETWEALWHSIIVFIILQGIV